MIALQLTSFAMPSHISSASCKGTLVEAATEQGALPGGDGKASHRSGWEQVLPLSNC